MSTVGSIAAGFSGNPFPGVAQFGSALEWGSRGRWFDSSHSDQEGVTKLLSPRFFQYSCGFMGFLGPTFQNRSTVDVQPPKEQKQLKNRLLVTAQEGGFFIFLDTGREMIFDGPTGLSWELTREGGDGGWPAAGTEEMTKQPSFSSMETDISPFSKFK